MVAISSLGSGEGPGRVTGPGYSTATRGADLMKRVAAPMVGGLITSFVMELLVYPAINFLWRRREVFPGPVTAAVALASS